MNQQEFIGNVIAAAKQAGIEAAEVYAVSSDSFKAMCAKGEISDYSVNTTGGLSLRGLVKGKMGYASTEAMDEAAVAQLVRGVLDSAELIEDADVQEIYPGDQAYPDVQTYSPALDAVDEKEKLAFVLGMESKALAADPRITQVDYCRIATSSGTTRIANSYGLNLSQRSNMAVAVLEAIAKEGERVSTGTGFAVSRDFAALNQDKIVKDAVDEALFMLRAAPIASGTYRVIIKNICMPDLLAVYSGIFSAENTQKGMSLLAGKEGETIASDIVTLMDNPLLDGGISSTPFDSEGVACSEKAVIENGVLKTLLHNLKTARKAGVKTTGNAAKGSYASPVRVAPTNFYIKPGEKTLEELQNDVGDGLVITEVSGLHAGANPVSGDFSLLAKGYTIKGGVKDQAVEQVTVAGNFYTLLKNIRAIGSDLLFPGSPFGSPSLDVGEMSVAGK